MSKKKAKRKNIKKKNTIKKKTKKRKLKIGRIFLVILFLVIIIFLAKTFLKFPIKNFYITGNINLKDQEIIDLAKLQNYPSIFKYTKGEIEKNIEKSPYIKSASVKIKKFSEVHINVIENTVLFYNSNTKKTVLLDKTEVNKELKAPILINYVPDKVYKKLIDKLSLIDLNIINRISEIKYDPSNVDEERFLFTMNDGNYVYITLEKLESINNYTKISLEIINKFGKKNGILNLDAGEYFEIFDD